jgi:hypothetical protein
MADGATNRYSRLLSLELGWIHRRKRAGWIGCEASTNYEGGPLSRRTHQLGQLAKTPGGMPRTGEIGQKGAPSGEEGGQRKAGKET